jgi:predicted nucleic acid-binding protein
MPIDTQLATEQWTRFQFCRDRGHLDFIDKAEKCECFFRGEQWSVDDLNALKLARRPALTINKIISTLGTLMGEQIYNRSEVLFRPSAGSPSETAEALTKVWMQIAQNNQLPWTRSELFADGIIRSRGFIDARLDFTDSMQGEVRIINVNSKNVVIDPDAEEYDPDSWNDVFVTKWLTTQDVATIYSEDDAEYLKDKDGSAFPYGYDSIERVRDRFGGVLPLAGYYGVVEPYQVRRNVRVLDRQYRRLDKQLHFVDIKTGDMRPIPATWDRNKIASVLEKARGQLSTTKKLVKRVRWTVTADNVVLHDDWSPYKHFTVIPYFPYFRYGHTIGLVENLLGSQELLNKTTSQELHVVNTTANSGWKVVTGSLKNMSIEELEQQGAATGLVLELDKLDGAEKITPNATPQGLDRLSYKAEEHIKGISNVNDAMQGFSREDVAAKAIQTNRDSGSMSTTKVMDNLERTDYILARNVLDMVQEFYTEERIITITHDDVTQQAESMTVNQYNEADGQIVNDLTLGEYSIIISSQPYRASLEDSQFDQVMTMRERGIQIPDSVVIEASRLQRKAEIIKQMAASTDSPEAQKAAQLQSRMQEAQVSREEAESEQKQADAKLMTAKAQRELALINVDAAKVGIAAQSAQAGGEDPDAAREQQEREFALQRDKHEHEKSLKEREFALKQEAHSHEMAMREKEAEQAAQERRAAAFAQAQASQQPPGELE